MVGSARTTSFSSSPAIGWRKAGNYVSTTRSLSRALSSFPCATTSPPYAAIWRNTSVCSKFPCATPKTTTRIPSTSYSSVHSKATVTRVIVTGSTDLSLNAMTSIHPDGFLTSRQVCVATRLADLYPAQTHKERHAASDSHAPSTMTCEISCSPEGFWW